jgi:hypothetical protein
MALLNKLGIARPGVRAILTRECVMTQQIRSGGSMTQQFARITDHATAAKAR